ncbi:MAG: hypothetical protein LC791_07460 [Acidobacteria bacterium]|nr:hypothetical protein [Acidobacteriota bacterium]
MTALRSHEFLFNLQMQERVPAVFWGARGLMRIASTALLLTASLLATLAAEGQWGPAAVSVGTTPDGRALPLTLRRLVDPSTRLVRGNEPIRFALHASIHFERLTDLFEHVDREAGRWQFKTPSERQAFGDGLLARGVESRIVSMESELPLEILLAHTRDDLERALTDLRLPAGPVMFDGRHWRLDPSTYRAAFHRVRERWRTSLNCWSAASSLAGRVLSNWYLIDEGITLFGGDYDSTEHFWQAVKYHPSVTVSDLDSLVAQAQGIDWAPWLASLERDQTFYFANAYALEFLKRNLRSDRLAFFRSELARLARPAERAREAQQRGGRKAGEPLRFTAFQEKLLWGDLADVLHLVVTLSGGAHTMSSPAATRLREALVAHGFDAITLAGYAAGRFPFLSSTFQELMFEIWKVKFLDIPRFGEVIRSTAGVRLDHFLDDGDSPDIPIPVYVEFLNRIRDIAIERAAARP